MSVLMPIELRGEWIGTSDPTADSAKFPTWDHENGGGIGLAEISARCFGRSLVLGATLANRARGRAIYERFSEMR